VCRLLFWTSVGRYQKIESSLLDGTSRRTLVERELLTLSSLTVDPQSHHVFWTDSGRRRIESASYDGSARHSVVGERLQQPGAVAVVGQHVYWVDEGAKTVERVDKETGTERMIVKTRLAQLTDLVAVIRPSNSRCVNVCGRLRCSHLCVVEVGSDTARCSCPVGMSLSRDSVTCVRDLPDCGADQVRCTDGTACVPRCDGVGDCADMVDEVGCYGSCSLSEFQCLNGATRCVARTVRCDGRADCDDASDEARCARCVGSDAVLCHADGRCIARQLVCDGRHHCSDGEDEQQCPSATALSPRASSIMVGSVCALVLLVFITLTVVLVRRQRTARRNKTLSGPPMSALTSKSGPVGLQAMIDAVSSTSCRGGPSSYRSPVYDRVPPGSTSTTSSSSGCTSVSSVPLYPRETLNPPPSPCTSAYSSSRHHPGVMTPCSTDVCDDLDTAEALSGWRLYAAVDHETEPLYLAAHSRNADDEEGASSLGWYLRNDDTATSLTRCSHDVDCEHHQHNVTRATSPLSSVS